MAWLRNVLIAIDQLGNAIAGGNPDATISARTGYFTHFSQEKQFIAYWILMERIINFTFFPLDGPDHCLQAYQDDPQERHVHGSDFARAVLGIIIIIACLFISLVTYTVKGLEILKKILVQ